MKPLQLFKAGLAILIIFILLSVTISGVHKISPNITIKIPSLFAKSEATSAKYKDISKIIHLADKMTNDSIHKTSNKKHVKSNAVKCDTSKTSRLNADSIRSVIRPLEYPNGNDTMLFSAFANIHKIKSNNKLIRILHYGDSQIEGDRITSYLRNQLQNRFGGCGIGLFPIVPSNPGSISYSYSISDNWSKFTTLVHLPNTSGKFGALLSFARINSTNSNTKREAWINLLHANVNYPTAQHFDQCRMFYGFNKSPMTIRITQNDEIIDLQTVPASTGLEVLKWNFPESSKNVLISIKTTETPDVFGIALDGQNGIAVDNIPLRGSSGLEFSKTDLSFLKEFYKKLNVKLVILQFGVNMVPYVTDHFDYYQKSFSKQLQLLKDYLPNLPIIVIGVSDVSQNGINGYETCPNVENIRNIQKKATLDAGYAFWDIYEAMGGKNSMPSWVFANPPLAQKDFTHFNPQGAKLVGEMFYSALMSEYNRYCVIKDLSN